MSKTVVKVNKRYQTRKKAPTNEKNRKKGKAKQASGWRKFWTAAQTAAPPCPTNSLQTGSRYVPPTQQCGATATKLAQTMRSQC